MTTDAVNKSSEDVEMKPYDYELIQKIPSAIEAIDALVNPLFEFSDNDEVSEKQFMIKHPPLIRDFLQLGSFSS